MERTTNQPQVRSVVGSCQRTCGSSLLTSDGRDPDGVMPCPVSGGRCGGAPCQGPLELTKRRRESVVLPILEDLC